MTVAEATPARIAELWRGLGTRVQRVSYLEQAAQALAQTTYEQFSDSMVIVRVFLTVPFSNLPPANQRFIQALADSKGASQGLRTATPVLSLIGTYGQEPEWCNRRRSKNHVGIPLISGAFVSAIPMISRLLKDLGIPLAWVDSHESEMIEETMGRSAGLFLVENAARATDAQGRHVIPEQDFVSGYRVRSVFGIGCAYVGGQIIVLVVFCRDTFPRAAAENFMVLAPLFKTKTAQLVGSGRVFAPV